MSDTCEKLKLKWTNINIRFHKSVNRNLFKKNQNKNNSLNILIYIWPGQHDKTFRLFARPNYRNFKSFHKLKIIFWLACVGKVNIILEEHSLDNNKM